MKAEARLEEYQAKLDVARAKLKGASADARLDLERKISEMQRSLDQAKARAARISNAADDAWSDLTVELDLAFEGMSNAVKRFFQKIG